MSPAFVRELPRRAALLAAEDTHGGLAVDGTHLRRALEDLALGTNQLTQRLLGARTPGSQPPEISDRGDFPRPTRL